MKRSRNMEALYPFVELKSDGLRLEVSVPDKDNGFYRGTRFDRAGVFGCIEYNGIVFSDKWFDRHDPYRHDSLTGPVEEFSQNGYDDAGPGGLFVKPGVGILRREDCSNYDWFHLYPVADEGWRDMDVQENSITFKQAVNTSVYGYAYMKKILLDSGPGTFSIEHILQNTGEKPLSGYVYNHNFFTLGGRGTGPWTDIKLPFEPSGNWRCKYDSVTVKGQRFQFSRPLETGETVYMGDIHNASGACPYGFSISSVLPAADTLSLDKTKAQVEVSSDAELHHAVFWGIKRVACIEPHTPYHILPGCTFRWSVRYKLSVEKSCGYPSLK